jgi:hypothetical protein
MTKVVSAGWQLLEELPEKVIEDVLRRVVARERRLPFQAGEEERLQEKVREMKPTASVRTNGQDPQKDRGLVWVNCPREEEMTRLIEEKLSEKARVHIGKEPPQKENPCCVLLCADCDSVASELRRLRVQAPKAPFVVFCHSKEAEVVEQALKAGASGFVHAGIHPEKIALALFLACDGEVIIPRDLLMELIGHRLFLRRPKLLDP